ncbi:MAG: hypothetical protein U0325_17195 [Polyangiales bacterium]
MLRLRDVLSPALRAQDNGKRVRAAAALNLKDVLLRKGRLRWLGGARFPRRSMGYDSAGGVEASTRSPSVTACSACSGDTRGDRSPSRWSAASASSR